jgi:hypothetical protein
MDYDPLLINEIGEVQLLAVNEKTEMIASTEVSELVK